MSDIAVAEGRPSGDGEAKVARAREGIAALDAQLASIERGPVGSEERNQMVALVLSVDETLRELEAWSGNGAAAPDASARLGDRRGFRRRRGRRGGTAGSTAALIHRAGATDAAATGGSGVIVPSDEGTADLRSIQDPRTDVTVEMQRPEHLSIDEEYRRDLAARVKRLRAELDERAGQVLVLTTVETQRPRRRLGALFAPVTAPLPGSARTAADAVALPAPLRGRRAAERTVGKVLTAAGIVAVLFLVFEFGLTGALEARDQRALLLRFQSAIVTTQLDAPNKAIPPGTAVALLDIPAIHVNQVIVEGTTNRLLKAGPGHLAAAPLPGEFGNAIVLGHRTKYGGPFRDLNDLHSGDAITVTTGRGLFLYVVHRVYFLTSGDGDVFAGSSDSRLTLVSADPPQGASGRVVAVALLRGSPVAIDSRPPVPVGRDELGLAADPVGAVFGLIWLQLFIVAFLVARRIRRTWNPTVTWLLAAPILLALLLLVFINVDLLLPGTL